MRKLLVIILLAISPLYAISLKLKNNAQLENTSVSLADVVILDNLDIATKQEIAQISIFNLNPDLRFQNLSSTQINQTLISQGYQNYQVTGQLITLYPANQIVSSELIQQTVRYFLENKFSIDELIELEIVKIPHIKIKNQNYTIAVKENPSLQLNGKMVLALQMKYPDSLPEEHSISVKLYKTYTVYKLKNSKKMSDRFTEDDLELNYSRELINNKYNLSYQEILEKVAASYCPKGKIITTYDIKSEPLVRKADYVVVSVIGSNFNMKYNAIAKNDAWLGEQVTLQNPDTKRFFNAKVIDKNLVAIYLEEK